MVDEQVDSFLDVDCTDAPEITIAEGGKEYNITWLGGIIGKDKNGHPYFMPRFEIVGEPYKKDFTRYHALPYEGMPEKDHARALDELSKFKQCFGIDLAARIDAENDPPLNGWAILGAKDDAEYGEQNTLRKYIVPK